MIIDFVATITGQDLVGVLDVSFPPCHIQSGDLIITWLYFAGVLAFIFLVSGVCT